MRRRVVITGLGAISGVGTDIEMFENALKKGETGFVPISNLQANQGIKATHASLVEQIPLSKKDEQITNGRDPIFQLALCASKEAIAHAGFNDGVPPGTGLVLGTCSGGMRSAEEQMRDVMAGQWIQDADTLFNKRYYAAARILAFALQTDGPTLTVVTACAAGAGAIAQGSDLIRAGLCDTVLVGGADTFARSTLAGFDALKATCAGECSPFSSNVGLNLGEGSAFLVLENLETAMDRNGTIYAEVLGYGLSNDAHHATSPDPSTKGQLLAMERTLLDAGASSDIIAYINAHGTGTRANDPVETRAIRNLLGDQADSTPVSSTKSMIGHCLGAAGILETAATIISLRRGFLPPTVGFTEPREGCSLGDYVPDAARSFEGHTAMTNSFGFGGNNACLLLDTRPTPVAPGSSLRTTRTDSPVITGMGLVHALGLGIDPLTAGGEKGIGPINRFEVPESEGLAGMVPSIDFRKVDRRLVIKGMDNSSLWATFAARLALEQANIRLRPAVSSQIGMVLGLSTGPSQGETQHLKAYLEGGLHLERVDAFPYVVQNEVAGHVARSLMLKGHNTVLSQGWGAGLSALISSAIAVSQSHSDTVIAAATDELTAHGYLEGIEAGVFGHATGIIPGEGAAALLVEDPQFAASMNRTPIAEILGYAMATDSTDPSTPKGAAASRVLLAALENAKVVGENILRVGVSLLGNGSDSLEKKSVAEHLPRAVPFTLVDRLGFAEASLPLINLAYLIVTAKPGEVIPCIARSREGIASAVVLRKSS